MFRLFAAAFVMLLLAGCGSGNSGVGSGGGGSNQNTVPITVNSGPTGNATNLPFVSVTLCVPGTSNCQTIDGISMDTGSSGLRILKSVLTITGLQQENTLVECAQFLSFFTWGPVMLADVKMAGEVASNIPIQVIGEANTGFPNIPTACQNSVPSSQCGTPPCSADTLQKLGANGILGLSPSLQDCGPACAPGTTKNPGFYYSCPTASACNVTTASLAQQLPNPVANFASDNNGSIVELPAITSDNGAPSISGTLIFGIGTQSNNGLGNATIFRGDQFGNITTVYNGNSYPGSFIDSGSNGIFFLTSALTGLPLCGSSNKGFYCPPTTQTFNVTNQGTNGTSNQVTFKAANVGALPAANFAFNDVTGENPSCFVNSSTTAPCFDWGLSFFFGRNVYTAIESRPTPAGSGPYWAY